ncbi:hypothetical protein L9F63_009211, partial [Diploptera punctata]
FTHKQLNNKYYLHCILTFYYITILALVISLLLAKQLSMQALCPPTLFLSCN